jgi:hypothetical protein
LYKVKLLTGNRVLLLALVLSVAGIPIGEYLWLNWYIVIGPSIIVASFVMLAGSALLLLSSLVRERKRAPSGAAPAVTPAPAKVGKPVAAVEKVDEDAVRLKVERTATESALKSLESAMKEGAIAKETFEKYKSTYDDRLRKIDVELSKRSASPVAIPKLEGEIDKVRQSYVEKLKTLSKKAISVQPLEAGPARPPARPLREPPLPSARPPIKLPEVPSAREEEVTEKLPPAREVIPQEPVSAPARGTPTSLTTIADLRREMMDELNRLKRLIGHAGS